MLCLNVIVTAAVAATQLRVLRRWLTGSCCPIQVGWKCDVARAAAPFAVQLQLVYNGVSAILASYTATALSDFRLLCLFCGCTCLNVSVDCGFCVCFGFSHTGALVCAVGCRSAIQVYVVSSSLVVQSFPRRLLPLALIHVRLMSSS